MIIIFFNYFVDENSITTVIASITCILVVCLVVSLIGLKTIGMKRANSFPDIGISGMFKLEICPTILQGNTFHRQKELVILSISLFRKWNYFRENISFWRRTTSTERHWLVSKLRSCGARLGWMGSTTRVASAQTYTPILIKRSKST